MAKFLNADYWKNSYLLEFRKGETVEAVFTFSVPPESEEFVFPQRKAETKTFGGAVIADYGNDLVQINLSGSTINQELKLIYKSSFGTDEMTGEQEAFYLRDLFKKYGTRKHLQEKHVFLYSLNGGGKNANNNYKWWEIFVGDFSISRSKDKPFCYNYKLSVTGSPEITRKQNYQKILKKTSSGIDAWYSKVKSLTNSMTDIADKIEEYGGGFLSELEDCINTCRNSIDTFDVAVERYVNMTNGIITGATSVVLDTFGLGDKVLYSACRYYPTLAADVWNTCLDCASAFKAMYNYCVNLDDEGYFSSSYWENIKELFDDSVSDLDIADVYSSLGHEGIKLADECVAWTAKTVNTMGTTIKPGDTGVDDEIIPTYGYKNVVIKDAETNWDQLSFDYYGDSSLGAIIATYNNMPSDTQLTVGTKILIPKLNYAESNVSENEVYNTHDEKDNYGKDILLISADFGVADGDLALASGIDNLEQALLNRYSTLITARIRIEAYGIQASIGDALNATSSLIQASVHQTTVEDPRVDSVENINFVGDGDKLTVTVIYIDINGARRTFGGTI